MVAAPNEKARQIEAMVGVQVRKQDVYRVGIGVALKRAEHTAPEIDDHRRGIGRAQEVPGCWRIRPDNTAGATEYGDSHTH